MKSKVSRVALGVLAAVLLLQASFLTDCPWRSLTVAYAKEEPKPRTTTFPSTAQPDQVCLTWSGDPATTQAIQWRTSPEVTDGVVQYRRKDTVADTNSEQAADTFIIEDPLVANDPVNRRFTASLHDLDPGAAYTYRVGSKEKDAWSEWYDFSTAPDGIVPFSFIYLGDVQVGWEAWGNLLHGAFDAFPAAAFCLIAGDIVNRGGDRDDYDNLFNSTRGVFDRKPLVPVIGNHECLARLQPDLYLEMYTLPESGPKDVPLERAYSFTYSNALFVILDGNFSPDAQKDWLVKQLAGSDAKWKFVSFHQPIYSLKPHRDNKRMREAWRDAFDKYHVDMVLQGHDHGYQRTYPMRGDKVVESPADGTVYVVSVSGSKYYDIEQHDFSALTFEKTSTYQVIDIQTEGENKMTYRAYDAAGTMRDELVIVKD